MILHPRAPEGICARHDDIFPRGEWQYCYLLGQKEDETLVYTARENWHNAKLHLDKHCSNTREPVGHFIQTKALLRMPRNNMCRNCVTSSQETPLSEEHVRSFVVSRTNKHGNHDTRVTPVVTVPFHMNLQRLRNPDPDETLDTLERIQRIRLRVEAERRVRGERILARWRRCVEMGVVPNFFQTNGELTRIEDSTEPPGGRPYQYEGECFTWTGEPANYIPDLPWQRLVFNGPRMYPDHLDGDDNLDDLRMQWIARARQWRTECPSGCGYVLIRWGCYFADSMHERVDQYHRPLISRLMFVCHEAKLITGNPLY
jgi:hypothetical protein